MSIEMPTPPDFIVICNWCETQRCKHYPPVFDVGRGQYVNPGRKVLRRDGKTFEEAVYNENRVR